MNVIGDPPDTLTEMNHRYLKPPTRARKLL